MPDRDDALHDELAKLQRINHEQTTRLRLLGLDLAEMPGDFNAALDEFVAIQTETGLLSVSDTALQLWYQDRKSEMIQLAECLATSRNHCRQLEAQLADVNQEANELEALLASADTERRTAEETAGALAKLDKEIGDNRHKLDSMQKVPDDIDVMEIMEKVRALKVLKHKP